LYPGNPDELTNEKLDAFIAQALEDNLTPFTGK
jgi:hypothetical protein